MIYNMSDSQAFALLADPNKVDVKKTEDSGASNEANPNVNLLENKMEKESRTTSTPLPEPIPMSARPPTPPKESSGSESILNLLEETSKTSVKEPDTKKESENEKHTLDLSDVEIKQDVPEPKP